MDINGKANNKANKSKLYLYNIILPCLKCIILVFTSNPQDENQCFIAQRKETYLLVFFHWICRQ